MNIVRQINRSKASLYLICVVKIKEIKDYTQTHNTLGYD